MKGLGFFVVLLLIGLAYSQNFDGYININYSFQPEGIEFINYEGHRGFLLSSLNSDSIYICSDAGSCDIFTRGEGELTATVGLQVDYDNALLYACNVESVTNITDKASVVALNLADGSIHWHASVTHLGEAGAPKLVNDVSLPDGNGNIYATESLQGLVFKISSSGQASLFTDLDLLASQDALGLGANGIEIISFEGEEYLLVGVSGLTPSTSYLLRIPLQNPKNAEKVLISNADNVYSFDGLYYDRVAENLYSVNNNENLIQKLASTDGWKTAALIGELTPKCPGAPASTVVHLDNNPNHVGSVYALCPLAFSARGPYQIENVEFFEVSPSYLYEYYYFTSNSASSLTYIFALVAVIALAL